MKGYLTLPNATGSMEKFPVPAKTSFLRVYAVRVCLGQIANLRLAIKKYAVSRLPDVHFHMFPVNDNAVSHRADESNHDFGE